MPSRKIEQQLDLLNLLRSAEPTEATVAVLRKALTNPVNVVIAKAAKIAGELQLQAVIPELVKAFETLLQNPVETDPKCWGKEAISKALINLGHSESATFLRGLRHVQMEPIWGTEVDTAATLRGTCALALLQCTDLTREDKLWRLMRALTDKQAPVRIDAARALEQLEGIEAALLLRLKARMGDSESSVTGQALESLLGVEGETAVPFVSEFLTSRDDEVREQAALALGASRVPAAIALLIETWGKFRSEALLRGISASRQESAIQFLLDLLRQGPEHEAMAALQALELHRDSAEIKKQVVEVVKIRGSATLLRWLERNLQ